MSNYALTTFCETISALAFGSGKIDIVQVSPGVLAVMATFDMPH